MKNSSPGYGYLRNDNLDATPWSGTTHTVCDPSLTARQCSDLKKPEFRREEFGGNIGGPLWRRKRVYLWPGQLRWTASAGHVEFWAHGSF